MSAPGWKAAIARASHIGRFSSRPVGVERFQAICHHSVDSARGFVLLVGIGTRPTVNCRIAKGCIRSR
jgi:hypothetical protein